MSSNEGTLKKIVEEAEKNYISGKIDDALQILSGVSTYNFQVSLLRSKLFLRKNDFFSALRDLELCASESPNEKWTFFYCAICCLNMLDLPRARGYLKLCFSFGRKCKDKDKEKFNEECINLEKSIESKEYDLKKKISSSSSFSKYIIFLRTVLKRGMYINKLDVSLEDSSNRRVVANDNIKDKELILRIPLSLLITLKDAEEELGDSFSPEFRKKLYSPNHSLLACFLLNEMEKKENSEWFFYFNFLPSSFSSFPLFYQDSLLSILEHTHFLELLRRRRQEIRLDYEALVSHIPGFSRFSFEKFCNARSLVSSRIFGVTINGKRTDVVAPFADLLNHRRPRMAHWTYNDKGGCFDVSAVGDIKKGQEVYDSYGIKCNSRFLLNYGFTNEHNEENEIKIFIPISPEIPYMDEKLSLLGSKFFLRQLPLGIGCGNKKCLLFFSYLRLILYDGADLGEADFASPISIPLEIQLLEKLGEIMENKLEEFDKTLEEDEKYLKENRRKMEINEYNCYIIRIGEKRIYKYYKEMADTMLNFLKAGKENIKYLVREMSNLDNKENYMYKNNLKDLFSGVNKYKSYVKSLLPLIFSENNNG